MFRKIRGQKRAISLLQRAIRTDKVASSYLFYGPDGVGKYTTALYFAMALNCNAEMEKRPCGVCVSCKKFLQFNHPDFIYIFPTPNLKMTIEGEISPDKIDEYQAFLENKKCTPWKEFFFSQHTEIRIDSIRLLEHRIHLSPNEGSYKTYLIEQADLMNVQASNAFLKTLEEPPENTVIILTSSKPNALLPTILSRCQKIPFSLVNRAEIEKELEETKFIKPIEAKMYARIANGNIEKALRLSDEGLLHSRDQALQLIQIAFDGADYKFLEFMKPYCSSKAKNLLSEIFSQLIMWFADLAFLENDSEQIANLDKTDLLEKCFNRNPRIENYLEDITKFLEEMQKKLDGHVHPQLIITELYHRLVELFSE